MRLIIASNNENKIKEIKSICVNLNVEILSLKDSNIYIDVIEDGNTISENSFKKAKVIYDYLIERGEKEFLVLSDDSGLMVDYLGGKPGVFSSRYASNNATDDENNTKLLKELENVEYNNRGCKFITILTLFDEFGMWKQFSGSVEGKIINEKRGSNGFGYDPIFFIEDKQKTMGELSKDEKNSISHRYKALQSLNEYFYSVYKNKI